jgi:hypothetical protein
MDDRCEVYLAILRQNCSMIIQRRPPTRDPIRNRDLHAIANIGQRVRYIRCPDIHKRRFIVSRRLVPHDQDHGHRARAGSLVGEGERVGAVGSDPDDPVVALGVDALAGHPDARHVGAVGGAQAGGKGAAGEAARFDKGGVIGAGFVALVSTGDSNEHLHLQDTGY